MKKVILILVSCLMAWPLWAQTIDKDSARMVLLTAPGEKPFRVEHELQIGVGDILLMNDLYRNNGAFATPHAPHTDLFAQDVYRGAEMASGTIAFNYTCRTKKWLWFGATIAYAGFYTPAFDRITDRLAYKTREHFVAIMPTIRVSYINRKYLRCRQCGAHRRWQICVPNHGVGFFCRLQSICFCRIGRRHAWLFLWRHRLSILIIDDNVMRYESSI